VRIKVRERKKCEYGIQGLIRMVRGGDRGKFDIPRGERTASGRILVEKTGR